MQKIQRITYLGNIVVLFVVIMLTAVCVSAQETVTIPLNDLKQFQKTAAEREFYKSAYEDEQKKSARWQQSSADWKKLYESEKIRADEIQGGRIAELLKANAAYKDQSVLDKQRISDLDFKVRKMRGERKWWVALGFGTGFAAGGFTGYQAGKISF